MNSDTLLEGPRDPNIFKAVFTAGIPGSGKTTIVKKLTDGNGMKIASFDAIYEFLSSKDIDHKTALAKSGPILDKQIQTYLNGRLGLIIDKTSWDYNRIRNLKKMLESLGYESFMLYVNTDLNVAKQRALDRYKQTGRRVDPEYIDTVFKKLSRNIGRYQEDFSDKFVIVDNTQSQDNPALFEENLEFAQRKLNKFLRSRPTNPIATDWLKQSV
jgi:predicted ABC-type ATPase